MLKQFHWLMILLIAGSATLFSTGCVCLFACSNPPPMVCSIPDEIRVCRSGLTIHFVDKNSPKPLWSLERGIEKNFQLIIQSNNQKMIQIACTNADAENAQGSRPICSFTPEDKVAAVSIENFTAPNVSITIEREGYKETFSDLTLSYTKQVFDPCGPPRPSCNVADLTLEVE